MVTIESLEIKVSFPQRYRELALKYNNQKDSHWVKPKKDDMLKIFNKLGYPVKYVTIDKLYIEQHKAGKYNFEYYFEFNGTEPWIYIYIKEIHGSNWPVERYLPGLGLVKKIYPREKENDYIGYLFFPTNLTEIESFFKDAKPMLDDLRKEVVYHLERNELDFTVN